jgi:ubiquitin carboxyl-terminal hydrolase 7
VSTQELTNAFGWGQRHLFEQQDVFEMWNKLLARIEDKFKGLLVQNTVSDLFSGKLKIFINCTHIDYKTSRLEDFYHVELAVDGNRSLDNSFREYTKVEKLDGEFQYYAGDRYRLQDAVRGIIFQTFPPVLVLRLKWWRYNIERDLLEKLSHYYEFPEEFNASPYLSADVCQPGPWTYTLYGVIMHHGNMDAGYFYAFLRPTKDGPFYKFDNDQVTPATLMDVKDANFEGMAGPYSRTPAILIYIRKSRLDVLEETIEDDIISDHIRTLP